MKKDVYQPKDAGKLTDYHFGTDKEREQTARTTNETDNLQSVDDSL
ncbi:hypothetical protein [Peribacillus sp. SCS-155]